MILGGDIADPARPPSGCHFRTRCPRARTRCAAKRPRDDEDALVDGHRCACFFAGPSS